MKTIDITFYTENGNVIETINGQELNSYETLKIYIEDYIDENSFGSIDIDSDGNGILGYYGHIGIDYGLAHSITPTFSETFYCAFNSYKEICNPSIYLTNPTDSSIELEITFHSKDPGSTGPCNSFPSNAQFGTKMTGIYTGVDVYPIYYNPPSYADCMVQPPGWSGGPEEYGYCPSWWSSSDTDGDGLDDHIEDQLFPLISPPTDSDGDGLSDGKFDPDTDGDGLKDGWEYFQLFGKQSIINTGGVHGYYGDAEAQAGDTNDGLLNWEECQEKTDPQLYDTDGDQLNDKRELYTDLTDPLDKDSDDDLLLDGVEVITWSTNPNDPDTDNDGMPDGWEVFGGIGLGYSSPDPNINDDTSDPDSDELDNIDEYYAETQPNNPDFDNDGRSDGIEYHNNMDPLKGNIDWLVMVYLDGDNNLEKFAIDTINDMEDVGCTDYITIIIQVDRTSKAEIKQYYLDKGYSEEEAEAKATSQDDTSNGDWKNTRRYLILEDSNTNIINSFLMENNGELNMGDPDTLSDFIEWGLDNFPADKNALILWDHGSGIWGCCVDITDNDDIITVVELNDCWPCFVGELNLIGFDCCDMSTAEVVYQLKEVYPEVIVASEWIELSAGWPMDTIFTSLQADPDMDAFDWGEQIVDDCFDDRPRAVHTLCAIDFEKFLNLKTKINKLAREFKWAMESQWESYYKDKFDWCIECLDVNAHDLRDLYYFANYISIATWESQGDDDQYYLKLPQFAGDVKTFLTDGYEFQKCIIDYYQVNQGSTTKCISIYLPNTEEEWNGNKTEYNNLSFSMDTNWDEMLDVRY